MLSGIRACSFNQKAHFYSYREWYTLIISIYACSNPYTGPKKARMARLGDPIPVLWSLLHWIRAYIFDKKQVKTLTRTCKNKSRAHFFNNTESGDSVFCIYARPLKSGGRV
jgi:hypothetical protein